MAPGGTWHVVDAWARGLSFPHQHAHCLSRRICQPQGRVRPTHCAPPQPSSPGAHGSPCSTTAPSSGSLHPPTRGDGEGGGSWMGEAEETGPANGVSLSFHCGSIKPTLAVWFWELTSCPLATHFFFLVWGRDVFPGPQMLPVRTQTQQLWQSCGELHREAGRPEAWERGL